jgi:hypothetical protein
MQVLASCRLGAITGPGDKVGTDTPAPVLGGDHGVLQPRMNQAIPQHVDESHQLGAFPGDYPAQAVEVDKLDLVPFRFLEHPGIEGFGVQRVNLLIGESAPPFVHRRHVVNLAPGGEEQSSPRVSRSAQVAFRRAALLTGCSLACSSRTYGTVQRGPITCFGPA